MEELGSIQEELDAFIASNPLGAFIAAALILVATAIISHVVTRLIKRLTRHEGAPLPAGSILINVARITIWSIGICIVLSSCFKVDVTAAVAAIGIGGIAISLGLKDTMANLFGGLQITLMGIVKPGDYIAVAGVEGIVEDVTWRQTVVRDINKGINVVPNSIINASTIKKQSSPALVYASFVVNNDGRELDKVSHEIEQRAAEALLDADFELARKPWVLFSEITDYGMNGKVRFVLKEAVNTREARDAVIRAIAPLTRLNAEDVL